MNKFLIPLALLHVVLGLQVTMNSAIRSQAVNNLKNALAPIITERIGELRIDDMQGKASGYTYLIGEINLSPNAINPALVSAQLLGGSSFKVSGKAFAMKGSARGRLRFGFVHRKFKINIGVDEFPFSMEIQLSSVNGKPNIAIRGLGLGLHGSSVHVTVTEKFPPSVASIIAKVMTGTIIDNVKTRLESTVPPGITRIVNNMLNSLPTDLKLADKVFMRCQFQVAPQVRPGYLQTEFLAYLRPFNEHNPLPGPVSPLPPVDAKSPKAVQFFMSDFVVRSALHTLFKLNLMSVLVEKKINGRQAKMTCTATELPTLKFAGAIEGSVTGVCNISLDASASPNVRVSATLQLKLSETVKQAAFFFNVDEFTASQMNFKMFTPADINWFKQSVDQILDAVIEGMNALLGRKGIPVPVPAHVSYGNFSHHVGNGYAMLGADATFNFRADEAEWLVGEERLEFTDN